MKVVIEGNIGAGKTSLAKRLSDRYGFHMLEEPVRDNPYLEKFYADKKRWALEMQFFLLSRRYMQDEEAFWYITKTGRGTVQDRSMRGDKVFAWVNYQIGNIDEIGYYSYRNLHEAMARRLPPNNLVIYLDVRPEVCWRRICKRDRRCETASSDERDFIDYLHRLDDGYRREIAVMESEGTRVYRVDWSNTDDLQVVAHLLERDDRFQIYWRGFSSSDNLSPWPS